MFMLVLLEVPEPLMVVLVAQGDIVFLVLM